MNFKPIYCGTDTTNRVHENILEALLKSGKESSPTYGDDFYTKSCLQKFREIFEHNTLEIIPMISGTATNSIAISSLCGYDGGVVCHESSHINRDECGAPEFFSSGAKLITISSKNGRLNKNNIKNKIYEMKSNSIYKTKVKALSITQLAENGTSYSFEELKDIGDICADNNIFFHMDGARFANALIYLNKSPSEMSWKIGLDCLSLGATKNGAYAAEVVIFFNPNLIKNMSFLQKKTGHVLPRTKLITCQLKSWLDNDLWLKLAFEANNNANNLRKVLKMLSNITYLYPTHGNEIFLKTNPDILTKLNQLKIYPKVCYQRENKVILRFVTSYNVGENVVSEIERRLIKVGT